MNTNENLTETVVEEVKKTIRIPVNQIRADPDQPRKFFDIQELNELAESIKEAGQKTPGKVVRLKEPLNGVLYQLVTGERRWRACRMIGIDTYLATVEEQSENPLLYFDEQVLENCSREDLTLGEEAHTVNRYKTEFGLSEAKIATRMGRSITWVNHRLMLLKLHPEVIKLLGKETKEELRLPLTVAIMFVNLSYELQIELSKQISAEKLSMEQARRLVQRTIRNAGIKRNATQQKRELKALLSKVRILIEQIRFFEEDSDVVLREKLRHTNLQNRMQLLELLEKVDKDADQLLTFLLMQTLEELSRKSNAIRQRMNEIMKLGLR